MVTCYLGVGSNLGDRNKNIRLALEFLSSMTDTKIEALSPIYETEPQGCPRDSSRFLNAVAKIKTKLPPQILLKGLKNIEKKLGRVNLGKNCSRPIDLDILFYGRRKIDLASLKVPHPRLRERIFVLRPLKDIYPEVVKSLSKETRVISNIVKIRRFIRSQKEKGKTIGFVPTMGYLHHGHLSLIKQAKKDCDICVVSIFVNPMQFGKNEDYKKYPRDLERDSILAKSAGCDCLFYPKDRDMYPADYLTYVDAKGLTECLCGLSRPGHFRGVLTVVNKLFNIITPDIAYFGSKDYQQALLMKKMVKDLNMPLKIKTMPIIRECDGLAMSSRNSYLDRDERLDASVLYRSLKKAKEMIKLGKKSTRIIKREIRKMILNKKTAKIDYIAIVDPDNLKPLEHVKRKTLIALAAWIGKTRLIDNIIVNV